MWLALAATSSLFHLSLSNSQDVTSLIWLECSTASTPLEFRTFWKAARHSQTALKTMRGDMESALQHNFQGPVQVLQVLQKFKQSTGFGGKCSKGSLGSRAEVSSSSFSCPSEKLWDVEISCILMYYIYCICPDKPGRKLQGCGEYKPLTWHCPRPYDAKNNLRRMPVPQRTKWNGACMHMPVPCQPLTKRNNITWNVTVNARNKPQDAKHNETTWNYGDQVRQQKPWNIHSNAQRNP